jgi:hypothetical protein
VEPVFGRQDEGFARHGRHSQALSFLLRDIDG